MTDAAVRTHALTKRYGTHTALESLDIEVPASAIYGLVGPNGAGKTTLLGLLGGLRRATSGSIDIAHDANAIAVLPDTPRFDPWLTGREVVSLALHLATGRTDDSRVDAVLGDVDLTDASSRRVGGYSRGMLQRLGLAATVVGDPKLLLLDEPCAALDPGGRREVLDLVTHLRGEATVLFSSHILSDVQEVCDTVGVLNEGRLVFEGPLTRLLDKWAAPAFIVRVRRPVTEVATALEREPFVREVERRGHGELFVSVTSMRDAERGLVRALADVGAAVVSLRPAAPSLEQVFLELTKDDGA